MKKEKEMQIFERTGLNELTEVSEMHRNTIWEDSPYYEVIEENTSKSQNEAFDLTDADAPLHRIHKVWNGMLLRQITQKP